MPSTTISPEYLATLKATHAARPNWGHGHADQHLGTVLAMSPLSVLDYGCGKGGLVEGLRDRGILADGYDPGVPEWATRPTAWFDVVTAFDVLEHIEEEYVPQVLREIDMYGRRARAIIDLGEAVAILEDGRNAHLTIRPASWWIDQIKAATGLRPTVRHATNRKLDVEF